MDDGRTFTVATDGPVISLIKSAERRLVVIAPALSRAVADARAGRFDELEQLDIRVIVDADAEVYRLGFGEREALHVICDAAARNLLDLRVQPGVRIGVIISDDDTMVYAPVSQNVEAGSDTVEKPNAIVLRGTLTEKLVRAAGVCADDVPSGPRRSPRSGKGPMGQISVETSCLPGSVLSGNQQPGALEEQVGRFVEHYNHARPHERLSNLTPADVYFGRGEAILAERERIKKQTLTHRRLQHHARAA